MTRRLGQTSASQNHRIQIALSWDGSADLDLHCTEPSGEEIFFGNKNPVAPPTWMWI